MPMHKTSAGPLALAYGVLVVYASLYPFEGWRLQGQPSSATACNCTVCRRYGVLWAYDYEGEGIHVSGHTKAYVRGKALEFHFCPECGCVAYWRAGRLPVPDGTMTCR